MNKFKKIICLVLVVLITVAPVLALATPDCCSKNMSKVEQKPMKCHEDMQTAQKSSSDNLKMKNCKCDCGVCKVASYSLPKTVKNSETYSEKFSGLAPQIFERSLSYGIFTPPKIL